MAEILPETLGYSFWLVRIAAPQGATGLRLEIYINFCSYSLTNIAEPVTSPVLLKAIGRLEG